MHELINLRPEAGWAAQRDELDLLPAGACGDRTRARRRLDAMITVRRGLAGSRHPNAFRDERG